MLYEHAGEPTAANVAKGVVRLSGMFNERGVRMDYLRDRALMAAYLLYYLPVNYLKALYALNSSHIETNDEIDILDIGSGPGTCSLAAVEFFRGKRVNITAIDETTEALDILKAVVDKFSDAKATIETHGIDVSKLGTLGLKKKHDVIFFSNILNELEEKKAHIVRKAASDLMKPNGRIIIIEPALKETTRSVMQLRDELAYEFDIIAPCIGSPKECPMLKDSERHWCHMYLDWKRPELIEKTDRAAGLKKYHLIFSYLILGNKGSAPKSTENIWRVVSSPLVTKGKCELFVCGHSGLRRLTRLNKDATEANEVFDQLLRGDIIRYIVTAL